MNHVNLFSPFIIKVETFILAFVLFFTLGYETNLKDIYPLLNLVLVLVSTILLFIFVKPNFVLNKLQCILLLAFLYAVVASLLRADLPDAAKYTLSLIIVLIFIVYISGVKVDLILKAGAFCSFIISLLSVPLYLVGIEYATLHGRLSGILFDPNYMAVLSGYGFLYYVVISPLKLKFRCICALACFGALALTFSKGAIIAVLIALFLYFFIKKSFLRLGIFLLLFAGFYVFAIDFIFLLLSKFEMFRVEMGFNKRDIYAELAIEGIVRSPFIGNGIDAISSVISYYGYNNTSFHNYYLEAAYINGLPYLFLLLLFMSLSFVNLFKTHTGYAALMLFFIVVANNFSFALGGVGLFSILFTAISLKGSLSK